MERNRFENRRPNSSSGGRSGTISSVSSSARHSKKKMVRPVSATPTSKSTPDLVKRPLSPMTKAPQHGIDQLMNAMSSFRELSIPKKQITLPVEEANNLTDKNIVDLIVHQCRQLKFAEWEVNALIQLCLQNQSLASGLSLIYQYAGIVDQVSIELVNLNRTYNDLKANFTTGGTLESSSILGFQDSDHGSTIIDAISFRDEFVEYIECVCKVIVSLCSLRVQQKGPKPIICIEDAMLALDSTQSGGGNAEPLLQALKRDASNIWMKIVDIHNPNSILLQNNRALAVLHPYYVVILCSCCIGTVSEEFLFKNYLSQFESIPVVNCSTKAIGDQESKNDLGFDSPTAISTKSPAKASKEPKTMNYLKLVARCKSIYSNVKRFLRLEEKVNQTHRTIAAVNQNYEFQKQRFDGRNRIDANTIFDSYYPTLRLPYAKLPFEQSSDLDWFINSTVEYKCICKLIDSISFKIVEGETEYLPLEYRESNISIVSAEPSSVGNVHQHEGRTPYAGPVDGGPGVYINMNHISVQPDSLKPLMEEAAATPNMSHSDQHGTVEGSNAEVDDDTFHELGMRKQRSRSDIGVHTGYKRGRMDSNQQTHQEEWEDETEGQAKGKSVNFSPTVKRRSVSDPVRGVTPTKEGVLKNHLNQAAASAAIPKPAPVDAQKEYTLPADKDASIVHSGVDGDDEEDQGTLTPSKIIEYQQSFDGDDEDVVEDLMRSRPSSGCSKVPRENSREHVEVPVRMEEEAKMEVEVPSEGSIIPFSHSSGNGIFSNSKSQNLNYDELLSMSPAPVLAAKQTSMSALCTPKSSSSMEEAYDGRTAMNSSANRPMTPNGYVRKTPPNSATRNRPKSGSHRKYSATAMERLGMAASLMSPYDRAEFRAESQVVQVTLRNLDLSGARIVELASIKIITWWRLVYPRVLFMRRMRNRDVARSVIYHMVDLAILTAQRKERLRNRMAKLGGIIRIQRVYRKWTANVLNYVKRIQRMWKRFVARRMLIKWRIAVKSACRIHRYLVAQRKRRRYALSKNFSSFKRTITGYFFLLSVHFQTLAEQKAANKSDVSAINATLARDSISARIANSLAIGRIQIGGRRGDGARLRVAAAVRVQKSWRGYLTRKYISRKLRNKDRILQMLYFVVFVRSKLLSRKKAKRLTMVIKIQKVVRGYIGRKKMFKIVRAGFIILKYVREYGHLRIIRRTLRRNDRPCLVTLGTLSDVPLQQIRSETVQVKVNVWTTNMLHIVSEKDFEDTLQSRTPQITFVSNECKPVRKLSTTNKGSGKSTPVSKENGSIKNKLAATKVKAAKTILSAARMFSQKKAEIAANTAAALPSPKTAESRSLFRNSAKSALIVPVLTSGAFQDTSRLSGKYNKGIDKSRNLSVISAPDDSNGSVHKEDVEPIVSEVSSVADNNFALVSNDMMVASSHEMFETTADMKSKQLRGSKSPIDSRASPDSVSPVNSAEIEPSENLPTRPSLLLHIPEHNHERALSNESYDSEDAGVSSADTTISDKVVNRKRGSSLYKLKGAAKHLILEKKRLKSLAQANGEINQEEEAETEPTDVITKTSFVKSPNKGSILAAFSANALGDDVREKGKGGLFSSSLASVASGLRKTLRLSSGPKAHHAALAPNATMTFSCDFNGQTFLIPGCHGNSVIRFDFLEGGRRKFASLTFHLSQHDKALFWGGKYSRPTATFAQRRGVVDSKSASLVAARRGSSKSNNAGPAGKKEENSNFSFAVRGGSPNHSL